MTVLSKPVPSQSHKSWSVIAGGHNRMIVQRRTEEGMLKNLTLAHRLTYGTTDLFKYRIIHTEDPRDFEGVYRNESDLPPAEAVAPAITSLDKSLQPHQSANHVVTTIYGTTISAETVNLGIANAHRSSVAVPGGSNSLNAGPNLSLPLATAKAATAKSAVAFGAPESASSLFPEKCDRMVVAIANTEEDILSDWEAIKDGWRMQGGGVIEIGHWESFYQGISRVAEEEANEEELRHQQEMQDELEGGVAALESTGRSPNTFRAAIDHHSPMNNSNSTSDRINLSSTPQQGTLSPPLGTSFGGWHMNGERMPFRLEAVIDANEEAGSRSGCTAEELWVARVIQTFRWDEGYRSMFFVCLFLHGWWYQWLNLMAFTGTICVSGIALPKKVAKHMRRHRRRSSLSPSTGRSPSSRSPALTPRKAALNASGSGRSVSPADSQQGGEDEDGAALLEESRAALIEYAANFKEFMHNYRFDTPQAIRTVIAYGLFANFISAAVLGPDGSFASLFEVYGGLATAMAMLVGLLYFKLIASSSSQKAAVREAEAKKRAEAYKIATQHNQAILRRSVSPQASLANKGFAAPTTAEAASRTTSVASQHQDGRAIGGLVFDGKRLLGDDSPSPSPQPSTAAGQQPQTQQPASPQAAAADRKPDLRSSILVANFEAYHASNWQLVKERIGVKYFDRPSEYCNKNINKFTTVIDGANAASMDRCLNDDPRQAKGKEGGANGFKYDRLLTSSEGTGVLEEHSSTLGIHTCYKSPVFGIAARDVATKLVAGYYLTAKEQLAFRVGLGREEDDEGKKVSAYPEGFVPNVWVMSALDNGNGQPSSFPASKGYQRAAVHRYLVLAEDQPPASGSSVSTSVRFTLLVNFDPQGSIPKSLLGATNEEQIDKVSFMRKLATEMGPIGKESMAAGSHSPNAAEGSSHGPGPNQLDDLVLPPTLLTEAILAKAASFVGPMTTARAGAEQSKSQSSKTALSITSPLAKPRDSNPVTPTTYISKDGRDAPTASPSLATSAHTTPTTLKNTVKKSKANEALPFEIDCNVGFAHSVTDWRKVNSAESSKVAIEVFEASSPATCGSGKYHCHRYMLRVEGANAASVERLLQEDPIYGRKMGSGYAACHPLNESREREPSLHASSEHATVLRSVLETGGTLSSKREVLTFSTSAYYMTPTQQAQSGFIVHPLAEASDTEADRAARDAVLASCNVLAHAQLAADDKVPPGKLVPITKGNVMATLHRYLLIAIDDPNTVELRRINTSSWPADERTSAYGAEVAAKHQTVPTACEIVLMMDFDPKGMLSASVISASVERTVTGLAALRKLLTSPTVGPQLPMYESGGSGRDGLHPVWSVRTGRQTAASLHIDSFSGDEGAAATAGQSKISPESLILREIKTPFDVSMSADGTVTSTYPSLDGVDYGGAPGIAGGTSDLPPCSTAEAAAKSLREGLSLTKNVFTNYHSIASWQVVLRQDGVILSEASVPWCPKKAVRAQLFMPFVSCGMLDTVLSNTSQRYMQQYDTMIRERREVPTEGEDTSTNNIGGSGSGEPRNDNPFVSIEHALFASPIAGVAGRDYVTRVARRLYCTTDRSKRMLGVHQLLGNNSGNGTSSPANASTSAASTSVTLGRAFIRASTDLSDYLDSSNGYQRGKLFYEFLVAQDVSGYRYSQEELDAFKGSSLPTLLKLAAENGVTTVPESLLTTSTASTSPRLSSVNRPTGNFEAAVPNKNGPLFGTLVTLFISADPLGKLPNRFGQLSNEATADKLRHLYVLMLEQQAEDVARLADRLSSARRR